MRKHSTCLEAVVNPFVMDSPVLHLFGARSGSSQPQIIMLEGGASALKAPLPPVSATTPYELWLQSSAPY